MIDVSKLEMYSPAIHRPPVPFAEKWELIGTYGTIPVYEGEKAILEIIDPQIKEHMSDILKYLEGKENSYMNQMHVSHIMTVPLLEKLRGSIINTPLFNNNYLDDRLICDATNNSPNIIEAGMFVWDLYIKISVSSFAHWSIGPNQEWKDKV